MNTTHEDLYKFLAVVREKGVVSTWDMSREEVQMAEELVKLKLLTKREGRLTTHYTYGINGTEESSGGK